MDKIPLSVILENAKGMLINAYNQVQEKTNIPAYLMEGIVLDLLSEVRSRKNLELVQDCSRMNQETESETKKDGEE